MRTKYTDYFISQAIEGLQFLEEMGGPETLAEYKLVMEAVKKEIDRRIECATVEHERGVMINVKG